MRRNWMQVEDLGKECHEIVEKFRGLTIHAWLISKFYVPVYHFDPTAGLFGFHLERSGWVYAAGDDETYEPLVIISIEALMMADADQMSDFVGAALFQSLEHYTELLVEFESLSLRR